MAVSLVIDMSCALNVTQCTVMKHALYIIFERLNAPNISLELLISDGTGCSVQYPFTDNPTADSPHNTTQRYAAFVSIMNEIDCENSKTLDICLVFGAKNVGYTVVTVHAFIFGL